MHESEDFWRENAIKLNDKDCEQLKFVYIFSTRIIGMHLFISAHRALIKLLKESHDPVVLAVAAHDIGHYVKHCDRGKKYIFLPDPMMTSNHFLFPLGWSPNLEENRG